MSKITIMTAALGAAALALAACSSSPSTSIVHGTVAPNGSASTLGLAGDAQQYSECALDTPKPSSQVTVTDPSGKVIGNAGLSLWSHQTIRTDGLTLYPCDMPFVIKNVPNEPRYGFKINGVPGVIWFTSLKHVALSVGNGS
jgi:hypothetical protein